MLFRLVKSTVLASLLTSQLAFAQPDHPDVLPGLWEFKVTIKSESGQLEAAMAQAQAMLDALPESQRSMMEGMLKNSGIQNLNLKNRSFEQCLTAQQIAAFDMPKPHDGCEQQFEQKSTSKYSYNLKCNQNPPMSGSGEFTILSKKSMQGEMNINAQMSGKNEIIQFNQQGTWLKADCEKKG